MHPCYWFLILSAVGNLLIYCCSLLSPSFAHSLPTLVTTIISCFLHYTHLQSSVDVNRDGDQFSAETANHCGVCALDPVAVSGATVQNVMTMVGGSTPVAVATKMIT